VIGTLAAVRGLERTSQAFRRELLAMSERLRMDPDALAAVMSFETAGTFDPSIRNKQSGAVGLIQFMRSTAEALGTTPEELGAMSARGQLEFVERYLRPAAGQLASVADHYMAVFAPKGIGKPAGFPLYESPAQSYEQNKHLDADEDGRITKIEAAGPVLAILGDADERPRLEVHASAAPVVAAVVLLGVALLAASRW